MALRDDRTPGARRNQRVLLPLILLLTVVAVVGLLVESEIVFVAAAVGVLACGLVWRWV